MDLQYFSPWNWFKKESSGDGAAVPVHYRSSESNYPVSRLDQEIDQVFNRLPQRNRYPARANLWPRIEAMDFFNPQLDIQELDDSYTITVEVPGIERKDIDVQVQAGTLVISGEKKQQQEKNEKNYHCIERKYGAFKRLLSLPKNADVNHITAKYKHGILYLDIKKDPKANSIKHRIEIDQVLH